MAADVPQRAILTFTLNADTRTLSLRAGTALHVGRGDQAEVRFADASVSRSHARFTHTGGAVLVEDLGSHNGTRLNGGRVRRAAVVAGDTIQLGRVTVHVCAPRAVQSRGAAPPQPSQHPAGIPVASNAAMRKLREQLPRLAASRLPVLVTGETGTGKELVARELHELGAGRGRPLVVVNCAAIPAHLIESVLFGHARGAFTGADRAQLGAFRSADGGTVFLDEIGDLALPLQAALLRVLETHRVQPVGETQEIPVRFRVVAATHRDIPKLVTAGAFRADLYHRLNGVTLWVPPLRQRLDELPALVAHFLALFGRPLGPRCALSDAALALLARHRWPGNIRELRNVIERAVAVSDSPLIDADAFSELIDEPELASLLASPCAPAPLAAADACDLRTALRQHEAALIRRALTAVRGNRRAAAALLKLPLRTLERKLQSLHGSKRPARAQPPDVPLTAE